MGASNGQITHPVSIADIETVIGTANHDLGSLCLKANINKWSRIRPCRCKIGASNKNVMVLNQGTDTDGGYLVNSNADPFGVDAGTGVYSISGSYLVSPNGLKLPAVTSSNISDNLPLQYPAPDYYRQLDFDGYDHYAPRPINAEVAKNGLILINDSNPNFTVFQFDFQNITDKQKSVDIRKLFNSGGLGELYLGFALVRASNTNTGFRVSTGCKLKDLFNGNVSGTMVETPTTGKAASFVMGQNGIVYFGFNFKNVADQLYNGSGITAGETWRVRAVALYSGSFISTQGGFTSNVSDCYSLEIENGFGYASRQVANTYRNPYRVVVEWENLSYQWTGISKFVPVNTSGHTEYVSINGMRYLKYHITSRAYGHDAILTVNGKVKRICMKNIDTEVIVKEYQTYGGTVSFTNLVISNTSNYRAPMYFGTENYANGSALTQAQIGTLEYVNSWQTLRDMFEQGTVTNASGTTAVGQQVSKSGTYDLPYEYAYIYEADYAQGSLRIDIEDLQSHALNSIINEAGTR